MTVQTRQWRFPFDREQSLRWHRWIPVLITLSAFVAVARVIMEPRRSLEAQPDVDDTRMFVVEPHKGVTLIVPAVSEAVVLHVVARVPEQKYYRPSDEYSFGVRATLESQSIQKEMKWDVNLRGRVSLEEFPPRFNSRCGARWMDGSDWLTDNREVILPVHELVAQDDGVLTLRAIKGEHSKLFVRAFGVRIQNLSDRDLMLRMRNMLSRTQASVSGVSLGTRDLLPKAMQAAITANKVRLDAVGQRNKHYSLGHVILSTYRRPWNKKAAISPKQPLSIEVSPEHAAAINAWGPLQIMLEATPGSQLSVMDGLDAEGTKVVSVPANGITTVDTTREDARSIVLRGIEEETRVSVYPKDSQRLVGEPAARKAPWGLSIAPDVRHARWIKLDPKEPVTTQVEVGQKEIRIQLRAKLPHETVGAPIVPMNANYKMEFGFDQATSGTLIGSAPASEFETWIDGSRATDPWSVTLKVPPGARQMSLFGSEGVYARLFVADLLTGEEVLADPYRDVPLARGTRWHYAPRDRTAWVAVEPLHRTSLESSGRILKLIEQIRIVPRRTGLHSLLASSRRTRSTKHRPEKVLEPLHLPLEHRLMVRQNAVHWKESSWTEITQGRIVEVSAGHAQKLNVVCRVSDAHLGSLLRIFVDGVFAAERLAITRSQLIPLQLSSGRHELKVAGLGSDGLAYVDAPPADHGFVMRRRTVYELAKGTPLAYRFSTEANESVTFIVQVATEIMDQQWTIRYQVFGGNDASGRSSAPVAGVWTGVGKRSPRAWFWDMSPSLKDAGMSEVRVRIPRSNRPGVRTVTLLLASNQVERVWARAVLIGQRPDSGSERIFVTKQHER